jgi:hypothetical protein
VYGYHTYQHHLCVRGALNASWTRVCGTRAYETYPSYVINDVTSTI